MQSRGILEEDQVLLQLLGKVDLLHIVRSIGDGNEMLGLDIVSDLSKVRSLSISMSVCMYVCMYVPWYVSWFITVISLFAKLLLIAYIYAYMHIDYVSR